MNILAPGTFYHRYEPDTGHFGPLGMLITAAIVIGSGSAFVGAVYALGRAMMAVAS